VHDCVIAAGAEISLNAAYMLIPRNLTRFSRNPKHAPKRSSPAAGTFYDIEGLTFSWLPHRAKVGAN
jgi:hypothetical protein